MTKYLTRTVIGTVAMLSFLNSCNGNKPADFEYASVIDVHLEKTDTVLSDFFDSWKYVALETTDSSIVGEIQCMDMNESFISIASQDNVITFDNQGKFLSSFNHRGNGPGEYEDVADLKLHNGDELWLMSRNNKRIFVYDTKGDLRNEILLPSFYNNFGFLNDSTLLLYSNKGYDSGYQYAVYSINQQAATQQFFPYTEEYMASQNFKPIYGKINGRLGFGLMNDYRVFSLDGDSVKKILEYHFDTPDQWSDFKGMPAMAKFDAVRTKEIVKFLGFLYQTPGGTIYQSFMLSRRSFQLPYLLKYNPETAESSLLNMMGLYGNPSAQFPLLWGDGPIAISNGYYVSLADNERVEAANKAFGLNLLPECNLNDDSNPILLMHHFKD